MGRGECEPEERQQLKSRCEEALRDEAGIEEGISTRKVKRTSVLLSASM